MKGDLNVYLFAVTAYIVPLSIHAVIKRGIETHSVNYTPRQYMYIRMYNTEENYNNIFTNDNCSIHPLTAAFGHRIKVT